MKHPHYLVELLGGPPLPMSAVATATARSQCQPQTPSMKQYFPFSAEENFQHIHKNQIQIAAPCPHSN